MGPLFGYYSSWLHLLCILTYFHYNQNIICRIHPFSGTFIFGIFFPEYKIELKNYILLFGYIVFKNNWHKLKGSMYISLYSRFCSFLNIFKMFHNSKRKYCALSAPAQKKRKNRFTKAFFGVHFQAFYYLFFEVQ